MEESLQSNVASMIFCSAIETRTRPYERTIGCICHVWTTAGCATAITALQALPIGVRKRPVAGADARAHGYHGYHGYQSYFDYKSYRPYVAYRLQTFCTHCYRPTGMILEPK